MLLEISLYLVILATIEHEIMWTFLFFFNETATTENYTE